MESKRPGRITGVLLLPHTAPPPAPDKGLSKAIRAATEGAAALDAIGVVVERNGVCTWRLVGTAYTNELIQQVFPDAIAVIRGGEIEWFGVYAEREALLLDLQEAHAHINALVQALYAEMKNARL